MNATPADPDFRSRLRAGGMAAADIAWFESFGFNDAAVPPVESEAQAADYQRRIDALLGRINSLSLWEREGRHEMKLAAALGARIADFRDALAGEDEE